jgi:orotate phosphoribosyltransferase
VSNKAEILEQLILDEPGLLDPPNVHHEFAGGGHGRKLSLKEIDENSQLYKTLIEAEAETIATKYDPLPDVLLGMANSANRIAKSTAQELGCGVLSLSTEKNKFNHVVPTYASRLILRKLEPNFALIIEDVGTTGKTVAKFIEKLEVRYKIPKIEALFTWQRQPELTILNKRNIAYDSLINHTLKTFKSAKECQTQLDGYCANGVELIERKRR